METICIQTNNDMLSALDKIAESRSATLEAIVNEALIQYLQRESLSSETYSFIGIAHSGKGNISTSVDETLKRSAVRTEGSLPLT